MAIEREKVLERDGRPARFLGMSIKEMFLLIGILWASNIFGLGRIGMIATAGAYLAWVKKVRDFVPERYFTRMFHFYWMPSNLFKAGVRFAEWRDPVRPS